jgi:hypothetical protein
MSRKSQTARSLWCANNALSGAKSTQAFRKAEGRRFINWAFDNGYPISTLAETTPVMVKAYLADPMPVAPEEGTAGLDDELNSGRSNSTGTKHNKLATLRRCMAALGADPDALGITAKALDLEPRSRQGTKLPIPDELFFAALRQAEDLGEKGFVLALQLERFLGMRGLEALMSGRVLKQYYKEAQACFNEDLTPEFRLVDGTKGGRPRIIRAVERFARESMIAISDAVAFAAVNGGYLINGPSTGLKSARANYHRIAQQVGLVGLYSPHSLRYAYAIDKIKEMLAAGFSRNDALRATAALLGHGPSRARYVSQVYGRTIVHTLPKSKPNGREIALTELSVELAELEDEQSQAEREEGRFLEEREVAKADAATSELRDREALIQAIEEAAALDQKAGSTPQN